MNYIIDPRLVYLLSVVDRLRTFSGILAFFLVSGLGVLIGCAIYNYVESEHPQYTIEAKQWNRRWYKWCKRLSIVVAPFAILVVAFYIFCPSKDTIICMEIAKAATYENVEFAIQQLKEAADYVINAINSLK